MYKSASFGRRQQGLVLALELAALGSLWLLAYNALPALANYVTYGLLGLDPASHLGSAVGFFLYDVPKILLLLTLLAFMMSVIALSLPEVVILRRVLKWQLIATFLGVVGTGIVIVGYLFNAVL